MWPERTYQKLIVAVAPQKLPLKEETRVTVTALSISPKLLCFQYSRFKHVRTFSHVRQLADDVWPLVKGKDSLPFGKSTCPFLKDKSTC